MRAALKAQLEANSRAMAGAATAMASATISNPSGAEDSDDEDETPAAPRAAEGAEDNAADALGEMMGGLSIAPLRGVAPPAGVHMRFDEEGAAAPSPSTGKPVLRGVPASEGSKIVFED